MTPSTFFTSKFRIYSSLHIKQTESTQKRQNKQKTKQKSPEDLICQVDVLGTVFMEHESQRDTVRKRCYQRQCTRQANLG